MRPRKLSLFPIAALLGVAVAVLPALAASSEVKLELNENCVENNWPCWTASSGAKPPPATRVTIAQGGEVKFADNTSVKASVSWNGPSPSCNGVPTSPTANWSGSCKFESPGTYRYESPTLFYTAYEVVVEGSSTTGTTTTGTTGTTGGGGTTNTTGSKTTTTGSKTTTGSGTTNYGSGTTPSGSSQPGAGSSPGSPLSGSAASAVALAATQHGHSVHGSVAVSTAGAGGTLEVLLFSSRASLASATHAARVRVGRLVRSSLHAGLARFAVALDSRAMRALHARHRLALTVKVTLSAPGATPVTVTRHVTVRA